MIDLTIDTCVLVDASQKGEPGFACDSVELLAEFQKNAELYVAVDHQGFVLNEYDQNINASMFASAWLRRFADRIRKIRTGPLPRALRTQLDEAHFSVPDRRFVQVARLSEVRVIVTRDPDYSPEVCRILRHHENIRVVGAKEALKFVRTVSGA